MGILKVVDGIYKIAMAIAAIVGVGTCVYSLVWSKKLMDQTLNSEW